MLLLALSPGAACLHPQQCRPLHECMMSACSGWPPAQAAGRPTAGQEIRTATKQATETGAQRAGEAAEGVRQVGWCSS